MTAKPCVRLEFLIPVLIVLGFLSDVAARSVRLERLTFRADEAVAQFRDVTKPGPFEPNYAYRKDRVSGDLGNLSNQIAYRVFRPQVFTTDDLGFRNAKPIQGRPPEILCVGTSFTLGSGNSDEQTLPAQLSEATGVGVYNAGNLISHPSSRMLGNSSEKIVSLAHHLGMKKGLILVEYLERYHGDPYVSVRKYRLRTIPYVGDDLQDLSEFVTASLRISPLEIAMKKFYKSLQNDRTLPNIYRKDVAVRPLSNGQPMLFLRDLERRKAPEGRVDPADDFARLQDRLRAAGFELAVVLVPEKLTVYRALLRHPVAEGKESLTALDELEHRLRSRGVTVINLAPPLVDQARLALQRSEVLYWADDTHWNPAGIKIAARQLSSVLAPFSTQRSPSQLPLLNLGQR